MIRKLVLRNIAATKGRLFLMLLSIVVGVSFVSGSFITADSLRAIFGDISQAIFAGIDVQIRGVESDLSSGEEETRFPQTVFDAVHDLDEVDYAEAGLFAFESIYTLDDEGAPNRAMGPPVLASSWSGPSEVSSWVLVSGRAPAGDEIAIDAGQAEAHAIEIGDTINVAAPALEDPIAMTVVGMVTFGDLGGLASPYFNLFDLETMQTLVDAPGQIDGIALTAADGVSNNQLISAVEAAYGYDPSLSAVSGETLINEQESEFNSFIDVFGNILLGFAIVVLFVSIFIIYNTFAILIGQRIRQFGLLRSIGMTGSQLRMMVLVEALVIGVLASVIGLFGGVVIAQFLDWLFSQAGDGGGFPDGPIQFRTRTIVVVFALGVGVTLLSALLPAFIAQRIPALAALRDGSAALVGSRSRRIALGATAFIAGLGLLGFGLFGSLDVAPRLYLLGAGAALLFIGTAALSMLIAAQVTSGLGRPVERFKGLTGRLARDNASRNPQRTAATASALMIGLALITGVLVLTQSVRATFERILDESVAADLFVYEANQGLDFAGTSVGQLRAVPEISEVAGTSNLRVSIDGEPHSAVGYDIETEDRVIDYKMNEGTFDLGDDGVLAFRDKADELGLAIGDSVAVAFEDDAVVDVTIKGLFDDDALVGAPWIFDRDLTVSHSTINVVSFVGVTFADGVDPDVAQAAAEEAIENFPQLAVENNSEFKETQEAQIAQFLMIIFGLLGLCILVAFIGIVNTMAMSVLDRTREIGLLRAIGTSRKQLRTMIRWEAVIVGVFGAMLGVALGLVIGIAAVTAIPDSFVSEVAIPWTWAVVFMIIGGLLGMLAAFFPASRASQMNVLDAISAL